MMQNIPKKEEGTHHIVVQKKIKKNAKKVVDTVTS